MKKSLKFNIAVFLIFISSQLKAQNKLEFDESGYKSVKERSIKEHKPIFYMLYASWCAHCNKMKSEVFTDTLVINYMKKNFICAWQDVEKGEGDFFRKKFGVRFYPTFLFLNEEGKELYNVSGEFNSQMFIAEAKNALTKEKQLTFLEQQFLSDVSSSDKCLAYLMALNKGRDRSWLAPIANQYLVTQKDSLLISANNWKIIANGVSDIQSREFQYVLNHQKEFEAVASPKRVQRKIENIVIELLTPALESKDTISYEKRRLIAKTIQTQKNDSLVCTFDLQMAERTKNWNKYKDISNENVDAFFYKDAKALKEIASNFVKNITDSVSLNNAIRWAKQLIVLNETYDNQLLLARLYQKNKKTKDAIQYATAAKTKNGDLGFNTKEADDLLVELNSKK
jgi:thioredoxin-related protein